MVKPVVGAVAGAVFVPAVLLGSANGNLGGCGCDGRALVTVLAVGAAIGAGIGGAAGLVTGVISDVRYICGYCDDPTANLWDPFQTNEE